jgi:uncharacterized membrane protein
MIEFLVGHALLILGLGSAALSLTEVALALTEQLSLPILAGMLGGSLALIYAGFSVISFTTTDSRGQTALLALAAAVFGVLGLLFWSTWEVDEQLLTLVFGGLSVVTLFVTEFIRRKASNRVNRHVDTPTS